MIYTEEQEIAMKQQAQMNAEYCETSRPQTSTERVLTEAKVRASRADIEADRAKLALDFFNRNPAFAEFIGLVRSGAIHI